MKRGEIMGTVAIVIAIIIAVLPMAIYNHYTWRMERVTLRAVQRGFDVGSGFDKR